MKKLNKILIILVILVSGSCNFQDCDCPPEIPEWLQTRISEDENIIANDPSLMQNYGAWYRYEFEGEFYYEYDNPLSSLSRNPYSTAGDRVDLSTPEFSNYWDERCCEKLVWKAPKYENLGS